MSTVPAFKSWKRFFVKDSRLRSGWRLLLYTPILAIVYLGIKLPLSVLGLDDSYDQVVQVVTVLLGTWVCRRFLDKRDMTSLGFRFHQGWLLDIGIGLLLGFGLMGGIFLVEIVCGWIVVKGFAWEVQTTSSFVPHFLGAVVNVVGVAVIEETFSRGYLLQTIEEGLGTWAGVIISSALFGVLHLLNPTAGGWADYVIPFTLTLAGFVLAAAYLVRRSLWLPIALHFAWNVFEYDIFGLTGAPARYATFLITEVTGPTAWVGLPQSSFGPEVGLLGVLAMLLGLGVLWAMRSHQARQSAA